MCNLCTCGDPPQANYYTCVTYSIGDDDVTYADSYTCSEHTVMLDNWSHLEDSDVPDTEAVRTHFGWSEAEIAYPLHYHVGHNTPGYLPEADIFCTGLAKEAAQAFYDELEDAVDDENVTEKCYEAAQSYLNEWAPTRIENQLALRPTDGGFNFDVWEHGRSLPVRYWLELATGNAGGCDWRDPSA